MSAPPLVPAPIEENAGFPADPGASAAPKRWHAGTLTYTSGGLVILFCWLLWGDFAWSMKERSVGSVVQLLLKNFGASNLVAGLLFATLPNVISIILGPIISYKSDRHRGRFGRRIPFLLIPTPVAVLGMAGLAFGPFLGHALHRFLGAHSPGENVSVLIVLGLFWTLFEFATITANSVFGGLINDVVPRPVIGRFYGLFRALSLIAGMIFNFWLIGKAETHYMWIFIGIGALYGGGFMVMCLKVKEGGYPPPPLADPNRAGSFGRAARAYFKECFSNPYYLWVFITITLAAMAFVPINLFNIFFAKSVNMSITDYGKCIALTYFISLGLSYTLGSLADRFHPLRVGLVSMALYAAATLWGGLFATDSKLFGIALVIHGVLSGTWMTATASIGQMLLPQTKFAQYMSAQQIVNSLCTMMIGPLMGIFLDHTGRVTMHTLVAGTATVIYSEYTDVYRYTYLAGFGLTALTLVAGLVLHRKFMALGGPKDYVAPE